MKIEVKTPPDKSSFKDRLVAHMSRRAEERRAGRGGPTRCNMTTQEHRELVHEIEAMRGRLVRGIADEFEDQFIHGDSISRSFGIPPALVMEPPKHVSATEHVMCRSALVI